MTERVWVVAVEHIVDGGYARLESSRIDSVWATGDSAVEYLDGMTGTTANEFGGWLMDLEPGPLEGAYAFDRYSISEMEVRCAAGMGVECHA